MTDRGIDEDIYSINWDSLIIKFNVDEKESKINQASMVIVGDTAPVRSFSSVFQNDNLNIYGDTLEILKSADYRIFNLESVLSLDGVPIVKGGPNLRGDPKSIEGIQKGRFNLACLANNHIMDYGEIAAKQTIQLLEKNNIKTVGVGDNPNSSLEPFLFTINDIKFGVINCGETEEATVSDIHFGACDIAVCQIEVKIIELKKLVDFVILIFHGGKEYIPCPSPRVYSRLNKYIELGVDLLIGHHPHVPQGFLINGNSFLASSLGNYLFHTNKRMCRKIPFCNYGYMVKANFTKQGIRSIVLFPYKIIHSQGVSLLKNKEREIFISKLKQSYKIVSNYTSVKRFWHTFCLLTKDKKSIPYLSAMILNGLSRNKLRVKIKFLFYFLYRYLFKLKKSNQDIAGSLNYLKNPTHYEYLFDCLSLALKEVDIDNEYTQILEEWGI